MKEEALKLADWLDDGEIERYDIDEASAMIRRLVEELDKQGDPVAYMWHSPDGNDILMYSNTNREDCSTPLYTTPQTKPLSDEEILEILIDKGICGRLKDGSLCYWQADADLHDFARAIEEKHGID